MGKSLKKYFYCLFTIISFSFSYGQFNPGAIIQPSMACYNSTVVVSNERLASGSLFGFDYDWEVSIDDGVNWGVITDEIIRNNKGYVDDIIIDHGNKITINGLKKKLKIRRKAKQNLSSNQGYSNSIDVIAQQENIISFPNAITSFAVQSGGEFTLPTASSSLPSTFQIYDSTGNLVSNKTFKNVPVGEYTFTYRATTSSTSTLPGCDTYAVIKVIVYDLASCNTSNKKIYATHQRSWTSGLSGVSNAGNAVNGDRSQFATLTGGVVILGIGTVGIDLYFTKPDGTLYSGAELQNKKVTIKLGEEFSLLKLAGGISVIGRNMPNLSGVDGTNVGKLFSVKGGLLDLLKGDNVFEFSFVPATSNGTPVAYNGVRIQLGSLLGVADNAKVFHAFIEDQVEIDPANNTCSINSVDLVTPQTNYPNIQDGVNITNNPITLNQFAEDVTWGNTTAVLNVATSLSSVIYPYYSIDNDYNSYAIFNTTVGVLNQQFLNVRLKQIARPGDQVQITLGTDNPTILSLGLLNLSGYRIKYYLGDTQVGEQNLDRFKLLDLGLLRLSGSKKLVISSPITIPFDRVQLEQFNTISVNLGNEFRVYDIRTNPQMLFEGQTDPKQVTQICAADYLAIQTMDYCTTYDVSFAEVTEYGEQLIDETGKPMTDKDGNPILGIKNVKDIQDSQLKFSHYGPNLSYYEIDKLYNEYGKNLLIKIQTKRQGCNFGDSQYLKVNLINCNDAVVNPVIRTGI